MSLGIRGTSMPVVQLMLGLPASVENYIVCSPAGLLECRGRDGTRELVLC